MSDSSQDLILLQGFADLASKAGAAILKCRGSKGQLKPDGSPVCAGDRRSENIILAGLRALAPELPVVSEESFAPGCRADADRFVLVDPLDGTREFLAGSDDFTVNIALIENGRPTLACLYAPALQALWLANGRTTRYDLIAGERFDPAKSGRVSRTRRQPVTGAVALTSLRHILDEDSALATRLGAQTAQGRGSSLKFGLIADGEADVYPRSGRVMAWDIAAGHAVLEAAGGRVVNRDGQPLDYRTLCRKDWAQEGFIAVGDTMALAAVTSPA